MEAAGKEDDAWVSTFVQVFGVPPTERQIEHLRWIASLDGAMTPTKRLRRVIAAFDQQDLRTAFNVRWTADDVRLHEVDGFSIYVDEADISVGRVIEWGSYERHLVEFFKAFLQPGMHVVDAGANIGLYSLLAAKCVAREGKVWAFEPNSENARLLLASAEHNKFTNIELHPVALGDRRGHVEFTSALGSNGIFADHVRRGLLSPSIRIVPVARLDDFGIRRANLLKMDVEGAEGVLLHGALNTIRRCRPVIVSEFSPEMLDRISAVQGREFIDTILAFGYAIFVFDKEKRTFAPVADLLAFMQEFEGTLRIEDLLFCPREKLDSLPVVA
jgi:FkbM family methyltransferase